MKRSRHMRSGNKLHVDGQDGISAADLLHLLTGRSEKEEQPTEKITGRRGGLKLIAPANMASGPITRIDTRQFEILRKPLQRLSIVVDRSARAWQSLPSRIRLAIIIIVSLLLGILIGLFVESHRSAPPPEPVWKSFSLLAASTAPDTEGSSSEMSQTGRRIMDSRTDEQRRERSIALWFLAGAITFAAIVFAFIFLR